MNKVVLIGRLTRDPEIRYSQNEAASAVARYTLAVDRRFKRQGETDTADFISCVSFGKTAEFVERYLKQGTKVGAVGRIQTGSYTNREGNRVYTTDVVVEELEFVESKSAAAAHTSAGYGAGAQGSNYQQAPARPEPSEAADGFMNIPDGIDEELPFN